MKKNGLLLLIVFSWTTFLFSQSKKDQISSLNQRVDSLLIIISNQNNTISQLTSDVSSLNEKILSLNKEFLQLKDSLKIVKNELGNHLTMINNLTSRSDSLSLKLFNQFAHSKTKWTQINIGETKNDFTFSLKNTLLYHEKLIKDVIIRKNTTNIYVSPISFNGQWVIVHTYQNYTDEYDQPGFFICNLFEDKAYSVNYGCPLLWLSWSPNVTNVLVGTYWEADMRLFNVNLKTAKEHEIKFPADIVTDNQGIPLEELSFVDESVKWVSDKLFEIIVNINCHPYNAEDCEGDKSQVITRSYTFTYDIQKNIITNKKLNK